MKKTLKINREFSIYKLVELWYRCFAYTLYRANLPETHSWHPTTQYWNSSCHSAAWQNIGLVVAHEQRDAWRCEVRAGNSPGNLLIVKWILFGTGFAAGWRSKWCRRKELITWVVHAATAYALIHLVGGRQQEHFAAAYTLLPWIAWGTQNRGEHFY